MMNRRVRHHALALVAAAAVGAAAYAGPANAAITAQPGEVCQIASGLRGWVLSAPVDRPSHEQFMYEIHWGDWFRVLGYSGNFYYGRGDGQPNGYLGRWQIDQASCHFT
jgi:hypothetical protein